MNRILFDITKASRQSHKSGLTRVSECLRRELREKLGDRLVDVRWKEGKRKFIPAEKKNKGFEVESGDVLLTGELFCEFERPGIEEFLASDVCRSYAIFHDAIPLQFPEFSWPHSVQRHPSYMKMLSLFDGVFAVSKSSSMLLEEYWEWLGYEYAPSVKSLQLGCNGFMSEKREPRETSNERLQLLCLGILERRKGQDLLLKACEQLQGEGLEFDLHVVGRTNPYFGKDLEKQIKVAVKGGVPIKLHGAIDDSGLSSLVEKTDLLVFCSRAEGCGLPVLEALWQGLPVLSSDLEPVKENARFGGCRLFQRGDLDSLVSELRELINKRDQLEILRGSIQGEMLPLWSATAKVILDSLGWVPSDQVSC
ncbi:glycosyltransferase [Puniceicoccaceae bacterium K14]|nr:glycosyltransferase [Puniceicoccaceae bacterium K14]